MKTYGKFGLLVVAIIGLLVWLAAGGISESKTYYKTISELMQMGDQAQGKRLRVGGDVEDERMGSDAAVRSVEARLALAEVRRAVQRLPAEQRNVLMLVTVEGLSYKEAAEVAGVPVGTIMSRLARARVALQQQLDSGAGVRRSATDA